MNEQQEPQQEAEEQQEQPQEQTPDQPQFDPEIEAEARMFGWKPPEEWVGDPPPKGFVETPDAFMENLQKSGPFRKLKEKYDHQSAQFEEKLRKIASVAQQAVENDRKAMQQQIEAIRHAQTKAVEEGDTERYNGLRQREDALREQMPQPDRDESVPDDHRTAIERWSAGKDWFKTDKVLTQASVALYGEAQEQGMADPEAILAYVDRRLGEEFPHKFGKPKPKPAPVEEGLNFGSGKKDGGFSKLPKDARDAFSMMVKQGLFKDDAEGRAQYTESYNNA